MADITPTAFQNEIMNGFAAFWAARSQIGSPNKPFDRAKAPVDEDAYIEWGLTSDRGGQIRYSHSVERNNFERQGQISFTANVRLRKGLNPAYELLDAATHFLEAYKLPNAIFFGIGVPRPLGDDGAWHQVIVTANWRYFTDRASVVS